MISTYFIFLYTLIVNVEIFYRKNSYMAIGTTLSAIFNIISNVILIQIWGYKAAAVTTLISYMLLFVFHWIISKKMKINFYELRYFFGVIFVILVVGAISLMFEHNMILRYIIAIILILLMLTNKKKLI